jgi:predicted acyl esterase
METQFNRRELLELAAWMALMPAALGRGPQVPLVEAAEECGQDVEYLPVPLEKVPFPKNITFTVQHAGQPPLTLYAHYWYNADALKAGKPCPAIIEFNPYRRRDGLLAVDSKMYPWFAYHEYLCFRVDLPGSGDSEGSLSDEYTEEELSSCVQVINQVAQLPFCTGNVGMMGESWSAINSLMVAARDDCPSALKAIVFNCGSDDRYNDDVHYMGGAMMMDNFGWASSMWGWLALPPDPLIVGDQWKEQWRQRIRAMNFWFEQWGRHQTRDAYWSQTSVRQHYAKVRVPVFILSGWQDGYKNPVDRAVRALGALHRPVSGLLGPWGHKYPFSGYPGPRIDWLGYVVTHWWDRWLKGTVPDPKTSWPQLTVWLGESREPAPGRRPDYSEAGKWVAEDHAWMSRTQDHLFYLGPHHGLSARPAPRPQQYVSSPAMTLGTSLLETSSFGECDNDDLAGDQSPDDRRAITFESPPLAQDLECFGYPTVRLTLECTTSPAALAIRLCEVSPQTGASHLVTYRFCNLCYRSGQMDHPQPVPAGIFAVDWPLNLIGHVFKRGWKLRLSISPSLFPTMWQSPQVPTVRLHTGHVGQLPQSVLVLPGRPARAQDAHIQALLGGSRTTYVNPAQYVPILKTPRPASNTRVVEPVSVEGRTGILVRKDFDRGSTVYGGALADLLVDQSSQENFRILHGDPRSAMGFTRSEARLERGDWKVRVITSTRLWSEKSPAGHLVFRYNASVQSFIADQPFEEQRVEGTIPRRWV